MGSRFNVSFVDWTSVLVKSDLEASLSFTEYNVNCRGYILRRCHIEKRKDPEDEVDTNLISFSGSNDLNLYTYMYQMHGVGSK